MSRKLFFLTTEITPFAKTGPLADYSAKVPLLLQEKEHDIRTMIPKYGFVSERKYILREVIRLRAIPFEFDGEEQVTSAKSAFIPKTRVQVYFLEHKEWFKPLSNLLYKSKNGRVLSDNDDRYAFFGKSALATLPHLFWSPDIIIGNGWQSAFIPIVYKQLFADEDFYKDIKTTLVVHNVDEMAIFNREAYNKAGVTLPKEIKSKTVNAFEVAAYFADQIIAFDTPSESVTDELMKLDGIKKHEDKLTSIEWNDDEEPDYQTIADAMDGAISKLSS